MPRNPRARSVAPLLEAVVARTEDPADVSLDVVVLTVAFVGPYEPHCPEVF